MIYVRGPLYYCNTRKHSSYFITREICLRDAHSLRSPCHATFTFSGLHTGTPFFGSLKCPKSRVAITPSSIYQNCQCFRHRFYEDYSWHTHEHHSFYYFSVKKIIAYKKTRMDPSALFAIPQIIFYTFLVLVMYDFHG